MPPSGSERSTLANELISAANSNGGWSYYPGKRSRLEPTAWALLSLGGNQGVQTVVNDSAHREFLMRCQRPDGWLVENAAWPINIGFNALVACAWIARPDLATPDRRDHLLTALLGSKGVRVPPSPSFAQDNSLQGWSWNVDTFSWVEPTAWGTLALKKALRAGVVSETAARPRILEAERLLFDRCCHDGGWNFGNANVLGRDLYPHAPTTAIALMALQDRADQPVVTRSLAFLESQWPEEQSLFALGLSLICFSIYGRPIAAIQERLRSHVGAHFVLPSGSVHGSAIALCALSLDDNGNAFRI